ncbi:MAG TPA: aminotransferase class I/II-fold pyridoxal phosphate-dependent enzyme [Pirellulaceae bacterium]|jgi:glycine C-acetyltransferase|nr:aminotransferase class I/II-fold pyridoxal phosphate-dependent enzyme [Pirellulaceae bacterium]
MPSPLFDARTEELLNQLRDSGQFKKFYELEGPLGATAQIRGVGEVVVLCSNNYLGLADHPDVVQAGIEGLREYGAGTASVRFICGTLVCHRELETAIAQLVGTPAALSYVSCWTANEAVFPTFTAPGDAIFSDELNHASIIDACRLTHKEVQRAVYRHNDLEDLESKLKASTATGTRWVVTDGVFSMEGDLCPLGDLADLCRRYEATLVVDDSHGIGVVGRTGRGTPEHFDRLGQIDVITGTLGKALGGAAGGYVAASERAIELLEQRARTSLFSNALPATVAYSARKAIEILLAEPERVAKLRENVTRIRTGFASLGYEVHDSPTAIIPVMIGDEAEALRKSARLMELGVMAIGFAFPVVPRGKARIRVQVSAALQDAHIEKVLDAFAKL